MDADTLWRWNWLKSLLFPDLRALHRKAGPWDLVIFTGDLSKAGRPEEFAAVDEVLDELWKQFAALQPHHIPLLLAVPGNHDLVRPADFAEWKPADLKGLEIKSMLPKPDEPMAARAKAVFESMLPKPDEPMGARAEAAFASYLNWWNRSLLRPKSLRPGLFPGDFVASLDLNGVRLGIVGMNSAILQLTAGDYEGRLWVHPRQFYAACEGGDGPEWASDRDACLLLTHHPPTWLAPESLALFNGCITDQGRFALHLFGHMHSLEAKIDSQNGLPFKGYWQASSLLGEESYEVAGGRADRPSYGYTAGELQWDGKQSRVRFWPRVAHCPDGNARRLGAEQWYFGAASDRMWLHENGVTDYFPVGRCQRRSNGGAEVVVGELCERRSNGDTEVVVGGDSVGWFDVAIGDVRNSGLLPLERRAASITKGRNPYVVAGALPADSLVFIGRQHLLRDVIEAFTSHDRPPSLSLLGERRIGKSSFLNQVFKALKARPGLVVVKGTVEAWENPTPALFFGRLYRALASAFDSPTLPQPSYYELRQLLRTQAERFHFLLMLDDFEELPKNSKFGRDFYSNLRALGDGPEYGLGYLICSRQALPKLCKASTRKRNKLGSAVAGGSVVRRALTASSLASGLRSTGVRESGQTGACLPA